MKFLFCVFFTFWSAPIILAQENVSLYFSSPQPSNEKNLENIPVSFTGIFVSEKDSLKKLIITQDSIYVELISLVYMSIDEVEMNPSLELMDSLLYGIYPNEPVQVVLRNDTVFFAIVANHLFFKPSKKSTIRICGEHLIFSDKISTGKYSIGLIKFDQEKGSISISYIDHEEHLAVILSQNGVVEKNEANEKSYFLNLSTDALLNFIHSGLFAISETFYLPVGK